MPFTAFKNIISPNLFAFHQQDFLSSVCLGGQVLGPHKCPNPHSQDSHINGALHRIHAYPPIWTYVTPGCHNRHNTTLHTWWLYCAIFGIMRCLCIFKQPSFYHIFSFLMYFYYFMYLDISPACMSVQTLQKPGEGVGSPRTRVTDCCELPCGYWNQIPAFLGSS